MSGRYRFVIVAGILLLSILPRVAHAAGHSADPCRPPECLNVVDAGARKAGEAMTSLGIGAAHGLARTIWFGDKAAVYVFDLTVDNTLWETGRDAMLSGLREFMPEVLRNLIGGSSGLLYLALMLSGLLLTLPVLGASSRRLVRPDRVVFWAVFVSALFVSSTLGYDLIGGVESLRVEMMRTILSGGQAETGAEALIMVPMLADGHDMDIEAIDALPRRFEQTYFPEPETEQVKVLWAETALFDGAWEVEFETDASLSSRMDAARRGLLVALLSIPAAYILVVFALIFALLALSALGLMVFLVAGLGLGFFEFGQAILAEILRRYFQIVFLSLGSSVFVALIGRALSTIQAQTTISMANALRNLALILPVAMVVNMFLKWSLQTMTTSLGVFRGAVARAFAPAVSGAASGNSPGLARRAAAAGLQAAGTAAMLAAPGVGGLVANAAANVAAQQVGGGRGDVFTQSRQGADNA